MPQKKNIIFLPEPTDGDTAGSALIVYTITVAISVSLLIFIFTISRNLLWSTLLSLISAICYLATAFKTLKAIELMVDITSFYETNSDDKERADKYKNILLYYNWSIIFIIGSTILVSLNIFFKYLIDMNWHYFSCLKTGCISLHLIIDALLICIAMILTNVLSTKWKKDIHYVRKAEFKRKNTTIEL